MLVLISVVSFILSFFSVEILRRWMVNQHLLDNPNKRSLHVEPRPRGGGLAIVFVILICSSFLWHAHPIWSTQDVIILVIGGLIIAGVSYRDDLHSLSYWIRFAVHIIVAGLVVIGIGYWRILQLPFIGQLSLGWLGLPLTFLWIVGLINAYNFMDGIDGIAGGQGVIAGLGWAILGWISGQFLIVGIGLVLAASCMGFLGHNWSPARIFMGDVGSAFLGYTFAVLPVVVAQHSSRFTLAGVLLLWPFIFDTLFTFLRRLVHHENVFTAHCSHLYQRLVATGFSHKKVTSLYIGLAIIGLVCSVAIAQEWRWADYLIAIMIVAPMSLLLLTLRRERFFPKLHIHSNPLINPLLHDQQNELHYNDIDEQD